MVSRSFLLMNCIFWRELHIIFPSQDRLLLFSLLLFNTERWWNNKYPSSWSIPSWREVHSDSGSSTRRLIKNQKVNQLTSRRKSLKLTRYTRYKVHVPQDCIASKVCWGGRQARLWERGSDSSRCKSRDLKSSRWVPKLSFILGRTFSHATASEGSLLF